MVLTSNRTNPYPPIVAVALAILIVAVASFAAALPITHRAYAFTSSEAPLMTADATSHHVSTQAKKSSTTSKAKSKRAGKWKARDGYVYYVKANGKRATGLVTIKNKTYLFDEAGRQKTGWQFYKGSYRYFKIANRAAGRMMKNRIINGIELQANGKAKLTQTGREELDVLIKAQQLAEELTTPMQTREEKLRRGFDWMRYECVERGLHGFSSFPGWHRMFANDILDLRTGSCFSYGAAFAYYANAIGYKSCRIVASGGHGWAEIGGLVYDIEWSRVTGRDYFAFPYGQSGGGSPNYASNRTYVVQIAPNTTRW